MLNAEDYDSTNLMEISSRNLGESMRVMDDMYFALVELVRTNIAVPTFALAVVIRAAGRSLKIDRSFATFQECSTLFNTVPNVHLYNALQFAIAKSSNPMIITMLKIFENMEAAGVKPNADSYSILFECMADSGELIGFTDILHHMQSMNIVPTERSLRRIAIRIAEKKDESVLCEILSIMRSIHGHPLKLKAESSDDDDNNNQDAAAADAASIAAPHASVEALFAKDDDAFPTFFKARVMQLLSSDT